MKRNLTDFALGLILTLSAAGLVLVAPDAPLAAGSLIHVEIAPGFKFIPRRVVIKAGDTVEWKNSTQEVHTVTDIADDAKFPGDSGLPTGAQQFSSGGIMPGGTYHHTFGLAGKYKYFCKLHELFHMTGEVVVKSGPHPASRPIPWSGRTTPACGAAASGVGK